MAEMFSQDFSQWLIGKAVTLTELKPSELSLEPIRADSIILLQSDELVLHIEFQTLPDENMGFRMADYRLRLYRKFPEKEVYQVVIYLKKTNSELVRQNTFRLRTMSHEFQVIRLWEESPDKFLRLPGLLPFAVLTRTKTPVNILTLVAQEIDKIEERRVKSNLTASTAILAGLLLDEENISRIFRSEMMKESVIYQEILAEGERKGEKIGERKSERKIALNLLQLGMTVEKVAQVTELSVEEVQSLQLKHDVSNSE
jgi:predicted transposase/invertase (TIGR01784 family)